MAQDITLKNRFQSEYKFVDVNIYSFRTYFKFAEPFNLTVTQGSSPEVVVHPHDKVQQSTIVHVFDQYLDKGRSSFDPAAVILCKGTGLPVNLVTTVV